jgi:hypothetical protein
LSARLVIDLREQLQVLGALGVGHAGRIGHFLELRAGLGVLLLARIRVAEQLVDPVLVVKALGLGIRLGDAHLCDDFRPVLGFDGVDRRAHRLFQVFGYLGVLAAALFGLRRRGPGESNAQGGNRDQRG